MQTLVTRPVVVPEGYFVIDCKLTKAGRQKFEDWFYDYKDANWSVNCSNVIDDMLIDAVNMESHPVYVLAELFSHDGGIYQVDLVEGVDYVFDYQSFDSLRLERLAYELNELHNTVQEEMARLGW